MAAFAATLMLAACGNKGDLVRPTSPPGSEPAPTVPAPAPVPPATHDADGR